MRGSAPIVGLVAEHDEQWMAGSLPVLPELRFTPLVCKSVSRLHCVGGTQGGTVFPSVDPCNLGIRNRRKIQASWNQRLSLPKARNHLASCLVVSKLSAPRDKKTDVPPIAETPNLNCNFATPMDDVLSFDLQPGDGASAAQYQLHCGTGDTPLITSNKA